MCAWPYWRSIKAISVSVAMYFSLQLLHSVRIRRWASIPTQASEKFTGSRPKSSKRVIVSGAELVCSVDSTKWPVNEASIPACAVSLSRISPIRIMSGSARKNARRAAAKLKPILGLTCTCCRPGCVISTGSSAVQIFFSGVFKYPNIAWSVVVLPEPVGPTTRRMPWGFLIISSKRARLFGAKFILSIGIAPPDARIRITTPSPATVGMVATRTSTSWPFILNASLPSWGTRFSAMFKFDIIFMRAITALWCELGTWFMSRHTPSTRIRTRVGAFFSGSIWISDALSLFASCRIRLTKRTTAGASSDSSSTWSSLSSVDVPISSRISLISPGPPPPLFSPKYWRIKLGRLTAIS